MKKTAYDFAIEAGLCSCDEGYKIRNLTAPDCPLHGYGVDEVMESYADQQNEWVMPDSTDREQSENLDRLAIVFDDGKITMYNDWTGHGLPHHVFLLPPPPTK